MEIHRPSGRSSRLALVAAGLGLLLAGPALAQSVAPDDSAVPPWIKALGLGEDPPPAKPFVVESRPAAASVGYLPLRPPVEPARKPLLTPDQIAAREAGIAGAPVPASKAKAADPKCAKPARCKAARAR